MFMILKDFFKLSHVLKVLLMILKVKRTKTVSNLFSSFDQKGLNLIFKFLFKLILNLIFCFKEDLNENLKDQNLLIKLLEF